MPDNTSSYRHKAAAPSCYMASWNVPIPRAVRLILVMRRQLASGLEQPLRSEIELLLAEAEGAVAQHRRLVNDAVAAAARSSGRGCAEFAGGGGRRSSSKPAITVKDAAGLLGLSSRQVRKLAAAWALSGSAWKRGQDWEVDRAAVIAYGNRPGRRRRRGTSSSALPEGQGGGGAGGRPAGDGRGAA